jgi:hypothetical protein
VERLRPGILRQDTHYLDGLIRHKGEGQQSLIIKLAGDVSSPFSVGPECELTLVELAQAPDLRELSVRPEFNASHPDLSLGKCLASF